MRFRTNILVACLLVGQLPATTSSLQRAKGVLRGIVTHARTGEPLADAYVSIDEANRSAGYTGQPRAAVWTDNNGTFLLTDVEPGAYRFSVGKNGFVRYGIARLTLNGDTTKDVRLRPAGTVSGRVSTTTNKPAVGVTINLMKRTFYRNGTPGLSVVATARTDDRGEYRLFWVTPGRYYLATESASAAALTGWLFEENLYSFAYFVRFGINSVSEKYMRTYFPGVNDLERAELIDVQEGADLHNIDMTVAPQQLFAVRGRVLDSAGLPPDRASIRIAERALEGPGLAEYWSGLSMRSSASSYNTETGAFELRDLAPGRYGLSVRSDGAVSNEAPPVGSQWAFAEVVVSGADIDNVALRLAVPPVVYGQIKVEGESPATVRMTQMRVRLISSAISLTPAPAATPAGDGAFLLNAISDSPARITMDGLPGGFYLKEARLNGEDVLRTPRTFSGGQYLEVTIGAAGIVTGRVLDANANPVAGIEVVLIPNQSRERPELFLRPELATSTQGRFGITGIPPGDYKLFAWESIEPNSFFDEQVLQRYEQLGTPVHIGESGRETVDVRVIPEDSGL